MNESLQKAITELLTRSVEGVDAATAFISQELPDYVYQLLLWYSFHSVFWGTVFTLGLGSLFFVAYRRFWMWSKREMEKDIHKDNDGWYFGRAMLGIFAVLPFIGGFSYYMEAVKIWIAPKLWLVEYASNFVK